MPGPPLGIPAGPEDLLVEKDGTPRRIDHAFSWEAPIAAHGMMHMVITNAHNQDPYPVDLLFMYMANMSWNSSMNTAGTKEMLTAKDKKTGDYRIPKIMYSDAYFSEMVAYADLVLPDTTYLERWDCISLLDRPICSAESAADSIRQPVVDPDRDVRPFQSVLIDLGSRIGLPGLTNEDGSAKYPGGYPDYLVNHERAPGIGSLAGWRGEDGNSHGTGSPNKNQLDKYVENGCFWEHELPPEQHYFKHANRDYLDYAASAGFIGAANQIILQVYSEPLQKFRLAAKGHGSIQPPDQYRKRIETYFDPMPIWYPPFEGEALDTTEYPLHALTQRPMAMYHSWGSQNAWLRQIHSTNPLYINRITAQAHDIEDGDWVWVISHHNRVKAQAKLMEGVNSDTVWTWNAIGKQKGAWNLDPDAPEAKTGFLLNHVISELLPPKGDGFRYANSDPVTGQAAWYDLRVRIEKCGAEEIAQSEPQFDILETPEALPKRPTILRYGRMYSRAFKRDENK